MAFLIRYSTDTAETTHNVLVLHPGPTTVEYPDFREFNARTTQDHAVIIQRALKDDRPRMWVWNNYRPSLAQYEAQWQTILTLEARARAQSNLNPIVQIWENESDAGGFGEITSGSEPNLSTYDNLQWTEVKIVQTTRRVRAGGGPVVYGETVMEFRITDASWETF